jgi:asparagine synthase (glutamine-hydrolysing)
LLAGAIELNPKHNLGRQLIDLADSPKGLAHIPYDSSDSWTNGTVTLVQQLFWNTPESKLVNGIACHKETGVRITAWARIDNREELLRQLPTHLQPLARTDPGIVEIIWVCAHSIITGMVSVLYSLQVWLCLIS